MHETTNALSRRIFCLRESVAGQRDGRSSPWGQPRKKQREKRLSTAGDGKHEIPYTPFRRSRKEASCRGAVVGLQSRFRVFVSGVFDTRFPRTFFLSNG